MKSIKVENYSNTELVSLRATVEIEMKKRNISFSVGEIGEELAITYFNETKGLPNLQAAPTGTKNIDALSRDGDRYSIKTRLKAKKTSTVYPDDIDPDKQLFEYLLLVKIDENYQLISIHQFTWQQFVKFRSWDKRMSAWYISCSDKNLKQAESIKAKYKINSH